MANNSLEIFGLRTTRIAQVNLVMQPNTRHGTFRIESGKHDSSIECAGGLVPLEKAAKESERYSSRQTIRNRQHDSQKSSLERSETAIAPRNPMLFS